MKLTRAQIDRLVRHVLKELEAHGISQPKAPAEKIFNSAVAGLEKQFDKERQLDIDARNMVDDLDQKNPGSFERHKMFLMIRKKLAEERKIVL